MIVYDNAFFHFFWSIFEMNLRVRIEESLSSGNLTVVEGETVMLVCTVINLGDKSVSQKNALFISWVGLDPTGCRTGI